MTLLMDNISLSREEICRIAENFNFPLEEKRILEDWKNTNVFENSMQMSKDRPKYTFYDGPPFATGLPHYGHILAGTIKDVVTRYAYQQGYHVDRRFGWDCHGLPVEFEIDTLLNIRSPEDVAKIGISAYNAECRKIVMRYANEWKEIVSRMGRWINFEKDYKTLYPWYMESIWWVFKQLFDKGLVYQGVKVMPFSTACTTPLSNFESGQNYKDVNDPCVIVSLESVQHRNVYFLIWTTTPWTLPSNFACTVNPNITYVKVTDGKTGRLYILAECRLNYVFKSNDQYQIVEKFLGKTLEGENYKPLFPYFVERGKPVNAFRILIDEYVTEDSGTGIVHNAPYFGEDDYRVCLAGGLITKSSAVICPIDNSGRFTAEVPDLLGQYVKEADQNIIAMLKASNHLVSVGVINHSYPFCWRSDTPLIYKAVPSWFVSVEHMSKNLQTCSSQTYWVPEFVRDKRFGNWLKDARDWAISRNRYWGTPIPIWKSEDGKEIICIGSIKQLEKLSGKIIEDLHRESIDDIEIPSSVPGRPNLRRINEVFDCWFESGSMPFAQQHFPFENEKEFVSNFPADFIAEGIDQTRGWFYTLLVISTALLNKAPFKNLIANGLVLAADGQKMSKRKKNYPDPMDVVNKYGADALRLYLINSPVVRAENLRFKEEGVRDIIKDVFLPWYNAFRFLLQNIARYEKEDLNGNECYFYEKQRHLLNLTTSSILDIWILSFKETLLEFFAKEMSQYHLYTVVPRLTKFIDQLTNWYVRLSRRRIKGELGKTECIQSLDTLYDVLYSMVIMMAPFTPFLSEYIFGRLVLFQDRNGPRNRNSVHYQMMPTSKSELIRTDIEESVTLMQSVIELGRVMRDRRTLPLKYPISEIIVIHNDCEILKSLKNLENFVLSELNVRKMTLSVDKNKYNVSLKAEPDHKKLGQRLKSDFKSVMSAIKSLSDEEIHFYLSKEYFQILGHRIELDEIRIIYSIDSGVTNSNLEVHSDNNILVIMDLTPNTELFEEGLAREIINRIQKLKKKAKLVPTDQVLIFYEMPNLSGYENEQILKVLNEYHAMIISTIKSPLVRYNSPIESNGKRLIITEEVNIKGAYIKFMICSREEKCIDIRKRWLNVILADDIKPRFNNSNKASLFLENSKSNQFISITELHYEIELLFGLFQTNFDIYVVGSNNTYMKLEVISEEFNSQLLIISRDEIKVSEAHQAFCVNGINEPFVKFTSEDSYMKFTENPYGVKL